ncbi:MAG: DUF1186 domain-containing protein [Motiliproteus sp.]
MDITPLQSIYQLKITLEGIHPPIWRRVQVASDMDLNVFHQVLQTVMGWTGSHLHEFLIGDRRIGLLFDQELLEQEIEDETGLRLCSLLEQPQDRLGYSCDFGDSWQHEVLLEGVLPFDAAVRLPCCLEGKRGCPPEDIGGLGGYADYLEIINDASHPNYETIREWAGMGADPEHFDPQEVNAMLADEALWRDLAPAVRVTADELEYNLGYFPHEVVAAAHRWRRELTPLFLVELERAAANPEQLAACDNYMLHLYAIYFLAQWREPAAFPLLIEFFSGDSELCYAMVGDLITEDLGSILASVFNGDIGALDTLVRNPKIDCFVRSSVIQTLVVLYVEEVYSREQLVEQYSKWLIYFLQATPCDQFTLGSLIRNICELSLFELRPLVEKAFSLGRVDLSIIKLDQTKASLAKNASVQQDILDNRYNHFTSDVATQMSNWACFREDEFGANDADALTDFALDWPAVQPVHVEPKIGRNEPCPCGSGKKFKKCCLH